jgi:hypothetical protein
VADDILDNLVCLPKRTLDGISALKGRLEDAITYAQTSPFFKNKRAARGGGPAFNRWRDPAQYPTRRSEPEEGMFLGTIPISTKGEAFAVPVFFKAARGGAMSRDPHGSFYSEGRKIVVYYHEGDLALPDDDYLLRFFAVLEHEGLHAHDHLSRPGREYVEARRRKSKLEEILYAAARYADTALANLPMEERSHAVAKKLAAMPRIRKMLRDRGVVDAHEQYLLLKQRIHAYLIGASNVRSDRYKDTAEYYNSEHELRAHSCNLATEVIAEAKGPYRLLLDRIIIGQVNASDVVTTILGGLWRWKKMDSVLTPANRAAVLRDVGKRFYEALLTGENASPAAVRRAKIRNLRGTIAFDFEELPIALRRFDGEEVYGAMVEDPNIAKIIRRIRNYSTALDRMEGGSHHVGENSLRARQVVWDEITRRKTPVLPFASDRNFASTSSLRTRSSSSNRPPREPPPETRIRSSKVRSASSRSNSR